MGTERLYVVFTKRLAGELCDHGFKVIQTRRDDKKPWLYVYLFEDTPELRAAIERYK